MQLRCVAWITLVLAACCPPASDGRIHSVEEWDRLAPSLVAIGVIGKSPEKRPPREPDPPTLLSRWTHDPEDVARFTKAIRFKESGHPMALSDGVMVFHFGARGVRVGSFVVSPHGSESGGAVGFDSCSLGMAPDFRAFIAGK